MVVNYKYIIAVLLLTFQGWSADVRASVGVFSTFDIRSADSTENESPEYSKQSLWMRTDSTLTIGVGRQDLLTYQFQTVYPPKGVDSSYRRSGFIHPLRTLKGHSLTRIQPSDHYHHYGIWNPWTHTVFEGDTVDFWNLYKEEGTVRFARFVNHEQGEDQIVYTVLHQHVVFKGDGVEKVALEEEQTVCVQLPKGDKGYYFVDISSSFFCGSSSPLHLLSYRYGGGFAWRASELWRKDNCEILTSEGNTREDTDGSRARWILAQGLLAEDSFGGLAVLSHPDNYNHPEPLRIWDRSANRGRGDLMLNYSPTKDRDWLLEPGQRYNLRYRIVVFDGRMAGADLETIWQDFSKASL